MGFLDTMKEVANSAAAAKQNAFNDEVNTLLLPDEKIEDTIRLFADYFVFTSRRVIFVDAKAMSSKRAIISIPYSKISEVAMSSGGMMNFSQEVAIQVGSIQHEVKLYDAKQSIELYKKLVAKIS
ncbi:PH domain-containing protein [Spirosoma lituiforme]